jgi:hypothetical protein
MAWSSNQRSLRWKQGSEARPLFVTYVVASSQRHDRWWKSRRSLSKVANRVTAIGYGLMGTPPA